MAKYVIDGTTLTGIANAIREKTGSTGAILTTSMASKIRNIEGGGGAPRLLDRSVDNIPYSVLSGISEIGPYACYGCKNLTSIEIPESVDVIRTNAFAECSNMSEVSFDDSVHSEVSAFKNCTALEKVYAYSLKRWCNSSFENEYANPLYYASELLIAGAELSGEVYIPDGVTAIPKYAFKGCKAITSVVIPASVELIEAYAFKDCDSLTSVTFENTSNWYVGGTGLNVTDSASAAVLLKTTYVDKDIKQLEGAAKYELSSDGKYATVTGYIGSPTNLVIADTYNGVAVTAIADYAFTGYSSLNSITIPASVTSIGKIAFQNCNSLTDVYITDIAAWCNIAFSNAYSNPLYYAKNLYLNNTLVTDLVIPEGVTSIGYGMFQNITLLESITISASVSSIGGSAFSNCTSLASVTFAEGSQLTSIGNKAFDDCRTLASIEIPASVTSIGEAAFGYCYSLASVTFAEGSQLTSIGNKAFTWCRTLASIEIPASVTSIDNNAFYYCESLASVTFEEGSQLTTIADSAFDRCKLKSIEIPANVTSIGARVFYGTTGFTVTVRAHTPPVIASGTFISVYEIIVPRGTRETYINATNWSEYANKIVEGDV